VTPPRDCIPPAAFAPLLSQESCKAPCARALAAAPESAAPQQAAVTGACPLDWHRGGRQHAREASSNASARLQARSSSGRAWSAQPQPSWMIAPPSWTLSSAPSAWAWVQERCWRAATSRCRSASPGTRRRHTQQGAAQADPTPHRLAYSAGPQRQLPRHRQLRTTLGG
jgi:hypothetical protein